MRTEGQRVSSYAPSLFDVESEPAPAPPPARPRASVEPEPEPAAAEPERPDDDHDRRRYRCQSCGGIVSAGRRAPRSMTATDLRRIHDDACPGRHRHRSTTKTGEQTP